MSISVKAFPTLGGWNPSYKELFLEFTGGDGKKYRTGLRPKEYPFYAGVPIVNGVPDFSQAVFSVDKYGNVRMKNAYIEGTIIAGANSEIDWSYIKNVLVKDAQIESLSANKITAGTGIINALTIKNSLTIGSGGCIRQGQTAYDTGIGFWLGDVSGTPKFSIGNSAGNKLTWDGNTLTIIGALKTGAGSLINGQYIDSLDAGKITTGYLSADRLDANTIYIKSSAMIANAIIQNAHIQDSTIQSAKIANLEANKIISGTGIINDLTIKSTLTMGDGTTYGKIITYNYDGKSTGFKLVDGTTPTIEIKGGTIIGGTIQTALSGARIKLDSTNYLQVYDSNGYLRVKLDTSSLTFYNTSGSYIGKIYGYSGSNLFIDGTVEFQGEVFCRSHLKPTGSTQQLGTSSYPWTAPSYILNIYTRYIQFSSNWDAQILRGGYVVANMVDTGASQPNNTAGWSRWDLKLDLIPYAPNSGQIGYATNYWQAIRANTYYGKVTTIQSFQNEDDIKLIKSIKIKKGSNEYFDISTIPKIGAENGLYNMGALNGLIIGTLKQLIEKVENLENKINELEKGLA
jgi:hypothetical protein